MNIKYVTGDATFPQATGHRAIIAHIVNTHGGWGKGFVLSISKRWKQPERNYREWHHKGEELCGPFELGNVQFQTVETNPKDIIVANMLAQVGYPSRGLGAPRYDMIAKCLDKLASRAQIEGASVHMPRIGTKLGGCSWAKVEPLIIEAFERHPSQYDPEFLTPVTVYDYPGSTFLP